MKVQKPFFVILKIQNLLTKDTLHKVYRRITITTLVNS